MASREERVRWAANPGLLEWEMTHGGTAAGTGLRDPDYKDWRTPAPVPDPFSPYNTGKTGTRAGSSNTGGQSASYSYPADVYGADYNTPNPYGEAPTGYYYDNEGRLRSNITGEVVTTTSLGGGGVFTRPTLAVVGERGPEVVIPYQRYLQWLQILSGFKGR